MASVSPAFADAPWQDPVVGALAQGAKARLDRAQARERAARSQVETLERAIASGAQAVTLQAERAAVLEGRLPELQRAADDANAEVATTREAYRRAVAAERISRKTGEGVSKAQALAAETKLAWQEARRQSWRALGALNYAKRGIQTAKARGETTARAVAANEAKRADAVTTLAGAIQELERAELWLAATSALVEARFADALHAEAKLQGTAETPREVADRAYLKCVASEGLTAARSAACTVAAETRKGAHRYLALANFALGRIDEAMAELRLSPPADNDAELRVAAGVALEQAARAAESVVHLEAALALHARDSLALDALAKAYLALGRNTNALSALDRLAALDPARPGIAYRRALVYAALGKTDEATALMASFVGQARGGHRDPSYAACQRDLYLELVGGDDVTLPAVPNKAMGHLFLAQQALDAGDTARADEQLAAALGLAPGDIDVRSWAGTFRLRAGDPRGAEAHLSQVLDERPGDSRARVGLGVALSRLGRQQEAIAVLATANHDDAAAQLALGVAKARAGDREAAKRTLEAVVDVPLVALAARHDLAVLSYYAGQRSAARAVLAETRSASPEGHLLRGLIALEDADAAGAIIHIDRALALQANYLHAQLTLGRALDQVERATDALVQVRRAVAIAPGCPEAHVQLGALLARAGHGEAAAAEYRKAETLRAVIKKRLAEQPSEEPGTPGTPPPATRRVAVVQFINANKADPRWDWLSFGIAEAVSTDLAQLTNLEVVERGQVATLLREIKFSSLDFIDANTAPKIGKMLGVDALVVGSFQVVEGNIRIDGRLVDLGSQRILKSGTSEGEIGALFALERTLALDLVGDWAKVDDAQRTSIVAAPSGSVGALEQLALTRVRMLAGDEVGAKNAYREAVKRSPELARRIQDMRSAYEEAEARVAVLPFRNASADPAADWLGVGIAESLATDMRKIGLYVVERAAIAEAMTEQKFGQLIEPERAARLGLTVGAQVILIGSYQGVGDLLAIDARMVQVETGAVILTERVSGKMSEFFDLQRRLSAAIARELDLQVGVEELAALVGDAPSLDDFKETILKDRLFVLRRPMEDSSDPGSGSLTAPVIVALGGLVVGIAGGVLFGVAEANASDSRRELALYRRSVDPTEMQVRYDRARSYNNDSDALRVGSYVAFGLAGVAAIYSIWALLDAASDEPEILGRVDVVVPRLAPSVAPGSIGVELSLDF